MTLARSQYSLEANTGQHKPRAGQEPSPGPPRALVCTRTSLLPAPDSGRVKNVTPAKAGPGKELAFHLPDAPDRPSDRARTKCRQSGATCKRQLKISMADRRRNGMMVYGMRHG